MANAVLYTDGSATILPDGTFLCGYAYAFVVDGEPVLCKAFPGIGTINQAEMCAVYAGMKEAVECGVHITEVYTDSTYVVNGLETNREKFRMNMWTNSQGGEVLNKDMWINLISFELSNNIKIPAIHIKGHTGQPFNELCDKLAKEAAMSQAPVVQYNNPERCASMFGTPVPAVSEPMPFPATYEVDNPMAMYPGPWGSIVQALSGYTDDRAKCCYIVYPDMSVLASKGVAMWSPRAVADDSLNTRNFVYPVAPPDGSSLPMYKYMTEVGTPLQAMLKHSIVQWQGDAFAGKLIDAISKAPGRDIYIASHNLSSMKKFQGIYIGTTPVPGDDGEVLRVYRSERADHGKCMVIPAAYCSALMAALMSDGSVVGLTTNTNRYCLIVTSPDKGMIISSAVIPNTFTCKDGFSIVVDKNDKISTRLMTPSAVWVKVQSEMDNLSHAGNLQTVITEEYIPAPQIDNPCDEPIVICTTEDISIDSVDDSDDTCEDMSREQAIELYKDLQRQICELSKQRDDLFNYIISDKFKCPEITPQKIEEIEARVRADMKIKLNSLFI